MLPKPENRPVLGTFSLKGKVALVTGGNRGIGLDVANGLAEAGAEVAIVYRSSKAGGEAAAEQLSKRHDRRVLSYQTDVSDPEAIASAVDSVVRDFGHVDIVVANAGICTEVDALDFTPKQFRELMAVNLDGAFYTAQAVAKVFKAQGSGNIIFTTSMSAVIVNRPESQAAYNASKAGLVQLAKSLAIEWIAFCRVNCISPGYIATEMLADAPEEQKAAWLAASPAGRLGETYELKGAYVFCASDASSFMTGAHIVVDGGFSLP
ncbi:NAD(P)-binding protein [Pleomassaria siparia CBS 279.74]|uniref:NADP-dependent mannitol dehydrogenase n=1 Tax=Pleomassaria siparia CBS 279.74 TaxID=1314801 RepID=A0A6G1KG23_9PLEO|nr:NAD(P)-binding protein [Pleomassaria siparia CBS 279.74]